jgi:Tfp pilus assembly protein PilV
MELQSTEFVKEFDPVRGVEMAAVERPVPSGRNEVGFTLVELLITVVILPLIIGAIAMALVSILNLQTSVSNRATGSGDAQVVSSSFFHDLQSAESITMNPSNLAVCGSGPNGLVGLRWSRNGATTYVSYDVISVGTAFTMVRDVCQSTGTVTSSDILSTNVPSLSAISQNSLICTGPCLPGDTFANQTSTLPWISTVGKSIGLFVTEPPIGTASAPGNSYTYNLTAAARVWGSISGAQNNTNSPFIMLGLSPLVDCGGGATLSINGPAVLNSPSGSTTVVGTVGQKSSITASSWANVTNSTVTFSGNVSPASSSTISAPLSDPYFSLDSSIPAQPAPAPSPTATSMSPGYYPTDVHITAGSGLFIIQSGFYWFSGSVSISGGQGSIIESASGGVLFYESNVHSNNSFSINTSGDLYLSPMSSPPTLAETGLTIWQDINNSNPLTIAASGSGAVQGAIYTPGATVKGSGSSTFSVGRILSHGFSCFGANSYQVG